MVEPDNTGAAAGSHQLWFTPPVVNQDRRRTLTRERLVAEALSVIAADGVDALSMRALATRLEVVPAALYRHVRNKEQLYDLVLDGVLAEVDDHLDHTLAWTEQIKILAHRLRTVLDNHPGIAALLKTRDPLGPHSLALAEAFLTALQEAGLPRRETALAYSLIYDYILGFALSDRTTQIRPEAARDIISKAGGPELRDGQPARCQHQCRRLRRLGAKPDFEGTVAMLDCRGLPEGELNPAGRAFV